MPIYHKVKINPFEVPDVVTLNSPNVNNVTLRLNELDSDTIEALISDFINSVYEKHKIATITNRTDESNERNSLRNPFAGTFKI